MQYELKRVPVWPVVKITFLISIVMGFFLGLIAAMFMGLVISVMSRFSGQEMPMAAAGLSTGIMIVIMPITYAFMCAVINTILALIVVPCYNLFAGWVGGLEFELVSVSGSQVQHSSERVIYGATSYPSQQPPVPPAPPQYRPSEPSYPPPPPPERRPPDAGENI